MCQNSKKPKDLRHKINRIKSEVLELKLDKEFMKCLDLRSQIELEKNIKVKFSVLKERLRKINGNSNLVFLNFVFYYNGNHTFHDFETDYFSFQIKYLTNRHKKNPTGKKCAFLPVGQEMYSSTFDFKNIIFDLEIIFFSY